jgi:hypothetical protein
MGISVALVGVIDRSGRGKMTYDYFLPPFEKTLAGLGVQIRHYSYRDFILFGQEHDAAILLYSEEYASKNLHRWNTLVEAEQAAKKRGTAIVIHPTLIGRIVADKTLTNNALSSAGIEMPKRVTGAVATFKVFSNLNMDTHAPTYVVAPRLPLDPTRYNTQWIDARHEYKGRNYYVMLRAMAVGRRCLSVFVRCRPVEQGDASVHSADTPIDADLLNFFYTTIVIPQMSAIESLCEKIANVLGLGFFSHDILPERETGRLLVCETGFKFNDYLYRTNLMQLAGQLAADEFLSDRFPAHSAELFAGELKTALGNISPR